MPYLGNSPASNFASVTKDTFSGDGSTTAFTLSKAATTNGVAVFVENVRQEPTTAYAVSGTTLTFTAAPVSASGNNIYVLHHNSPASTATHPAAQDLTCAGFTSTGIDDNADATAITIDSSEDVTLSGDLSSGLDKSVDLRDADGHVSGRLRSISSSKNALVIEADPDNSGSNSNLRFYIDGSERAIIDHNYDFKINNGDIFFGTAGNGIVLGSTSNSDSNTLDDYEVGTFTPSADGYSGTMTFTTAYYVKVGRQVTIAFKMTGDGTSDSSTVAISGFPFVVQAEHPAALSYSTASNANLHATSNPIPNAMVNTAEIMYFYMPEGTGFTYTNLGTGYIRVACTYLTTS